MFGFGSNPKKKAIKASKAGKLKSGSGAPVTDQDQAVAIGMSKDRKKKKKGRKEMSTSVGSDFATVDMAAYAAMRAAAVSPEGLASGTAGAAQERLELATACEMKGALKSAKTSSPGGRSNTVMKDLTQADPDAKAKVGHAREHDDKRAALPRGNKTEFATDCDMAALARERAKAVSRGDNIADVAQDKANAAVDAAPAKKPGDLANTGTQRKLKKGKKASDEIWLK